MPITSHPVTFLVALEQPVTVICGFYDVRDLQMQLNVQNKQAVYDALFYSSIFH